MTRTPLKKVSSKQRARKAAWAKVTKQRIADKGGICEAKWGSCTRYASEGHHRLPARFRNDTYENCLVCCSACHKAIHDEPAYSKEVGYIITDPSQLQASE